MKPRTVVRWHCKLCQTGILYVPAKHWLAHVRDHLAMRHGA